MHPLGPDVTQFTDTELQNKILELGRKMNTAYRMGDPNLIHQVQLLYNSFLEEQQTRERKKMEELMKSNGKDFDDIIDVN
jgi:hypothetical protein